MDKGASHKGACKNFEEFRDIVQIIFMEVPKEMLENLFRSMKGRVQECIEKEGGKTKY
jgi:hypothetical protein